MVQNKISVCYVVSSLCNEGPVNVMYNIIKYINFDFFKVSIITLVPEKETTRINDFSSLPIDIQQLSPQEFLNPLRMFVDLNKVIKNIQPDILHTHCPRSMFLVPFLSERYKKIETVHIYPGIQQKIKYGALKGSAVILLSHFFTSRMDLPIACSESVAESYWQEKRIKMLAIPNGCSFPVWKSSPYERATLRKQLGLKDNIRYFIFVGRFSKEKGPDLLVELFTKMNRKDIGIILLGNGEMYEDLKKYESDLILLLGFKSNVSDYLRASDFYISASDTEGLSNSQLESMAAGLPCVVSDIPSHREVMRKANKLIGYLYDKSNTASLIKAIDNVLLLDANSTSLYIQQLFEEYYTAKRMSILYQDEYKRIMTFTAT
ncbi:glycosyl transferase group 1 [Paludibacter propionicigenes WB4]|uniref:Glycosyl transferase group 1 n=1 Tax=Paludibacter propionicigenes (strain DSM 17365 / JCM 13257 / WB4) TaxID=694427 RepID=E4T1H5_PALPW|nr:glycosyltransferase [Paludibacter propionicigenes]ADQ78569.1 glycosyl transferase group 1 [Paludibacter propionicigenes WB4]